MAFESLASRSSLPKPGCSQRRISPPARWADREVDGSFLLNVAGRPDVAVSLALSPPPISPLATPPLTGRWVSATGEIAPSARSSLTYCAPPIAFQ